QLDAASAKFADRRRREMVAVFRDHVVAEMHGDLDRIMGTLVPNPQYHGWGPTGDVAPKGYDAVEAFYAEWLALKGNYFDIDVTCLVVDDVHCVSEQSQRVIISGESFLAGRWGRNLQEANPDAFDAFDSSGHYLMTSRSLIIVPFDGEGRMEGEDG